MDSITHFHIFLATALLINISPGADTIYIIGRTLSQGRIAGVVSVLGISSGCIFHILASALGLSTLLMTSSLAFTAVKWTGAAYLIWIGLRILFSSAKLEDVDSNEKSISYRKIYLQGLLTNALNPKVSLFFLALLPQFIEPSAKSSFIPFIILGFTFLCTGTIWCLIVSYASSIFGNFFNKSKRTSKFLNQSVGTVFIALGLRLALIEK